MRRPVSEEAKPLISPFCVRRRLAEFLACPLDLNYLVLDIGSFGVGLTLGGLTLSAGLNEIHFRLRQKPVQLPISEGTTSY